MIVEKGKELAEEGPLSLLVAPFIALIMLTDIQILINDIMS